MESEDTQASSKVDAAAVKRKRRSSILKNQRPPRTPFSEVEFNVATPPDTTKSRRVSFSRRTGVAEFVTNEGTTTWRNFYEEHNKSLESSGNENNLVANAPRQTIEHIGKRIFDQQFEEVEAVDLGGTIHTNPLQQFQASFNKINLTQELASLECMTGDLKFVPSQSKFEQSALTELSKPFGNDIQCPVLEDMTNPISMNFSTMQPLSSSNCDDLDEIQNDLERSKPSSICAGPMKPGKDFYGYIEVADLNVTHGVIHNDGSEMSITDTIESPKVVQLGKNKVDDDWSNDKENMVFNPYVAPKESLTFAVNKVSDEVLVFDGKRLTTQSITTNISVTNESFHQTTLLSVSALAPQRKTITLDIDDDLPNFIDNNCPKPNFNLDDNLAINEQNKVDSSSNNKSMANNTIDMCDTSNMLSFTQALSSNIIATKGESLHTNHCNDFMQDISMTQPVPNNIIETKKESKSLIDNEKRRSIIFAGESCDISMTQALQSNIDCNSAKISVKNGNTIIFDNNSHDISVTQALPANINMDIVNDDLKNEKDNITQKRRTIVFNEESCNISLTQAIPVNIFDVNSKPNNDLVSGKEKRRTIIFDHESCDISITQALPTNINLKEESEKNHCNVFDDSLAKNCNFQKRNTIIFDKESCDISMTQVLPTNINVMENPIGNNEMEKDITNNKGSEKRRTIIFDKDSCDISMTQVLPTNINILENLNRSNTVNNMFVPNENSEKRQTILFTKDTCDISMTQAVPRNIAILENFERSNEINNKIAPNENSEKRRTIIFDKEFGDISMTQVIPTNINYIENLEKINEINQNIESNENSRKRQTIIFDKESCDISVTQALPTNINSIENSQTSTTMVSDKDSHNPSISPVLRSNTNINEKPIKQGNESPEIHKTITYYEESCDASMSQALPTNIILDGDNYIKPQPKLQESVANENSEKRKTIIIDHESCNISSTQTLPPNFDIMKESMGQDYKNDMKFKSQNSSSIINDNISNRFELKVKNNEIRKTIIELDDNRRNEKNVNVKNETYKDDIDVTDRTKQSNFLLYEENKNAEVNMSLSKSIYLDMKEKMGVEDHIYDKFNVDGKKHLFDNLSSDNFNVQKDDKSHINKENDNKPFEQTNDAKSHDLYFEAKFKTNVSVYQASTNKVINIINNEIYSDKLGEMDVDMAVEILIKDKTINNDSENYKNMKNGSKKSILNDLLNMSSDSVTNDLSKYYEKNDISDGNEATKGDSVFVSNSRKIPIVESKTNHNNENQQVVEMKNKQSVILLENQTMENQNIEKSHAQFKSNIKNESADKDLIKLNMELEESIKFIGESNSPKMFKSVKEADNTKDLLKMLSDITDEDGDETICKQQNLDTKVEDPEKPSILEKNKIPVRAILQEPKRLSLAPRRQSVVISREDLLNNISMAKAALQQSRFEVDETDIMDDTSELVETQEINDTHKTNRLSSEVVKTLQFEDESASDTSIKSEMRMSPLRKSAVDEGAPIKDNNMKVIPTLLTDFSVSMKELMHDLVKPNSDVAPFENSPTEPKAPSTCNAEVETKFITSSQIDVSQEEPFQCILKNSDQKITKVETKKVGVEIDSICLFNNTNSSESDSKPLIIQHCTDKNNENVIDDIAKLNVKDILIQSSPNRSKQKSIVFNTNDPLKNIFLPPIDYSDAHRYNALLEENDHSALKKETMQGKAQINVVYGETAGEKSDSSSRNSNVCKPVDKNVESTVPILKEAKINTILVMKENSDLTQSSSFTLAEEKSRDNKIQMEQLIEPSSQEVASSKISLVKILFKNENDPEFTEKESEAALSEEISNIDLDNKTRKRSYSPISTNANVTRNFEITPKPISKMQKISKSPLTKSTKNKIDMMHVDVDEGEMKMFRNEKQVKSAGYTEEILTAEVQYNNYNKSQTSKSPRNTKSQEEKLLKNENSLKQCCSSEGTMQGPSVTISHTVSSVTSSIDAPQEEKENKIEKGDDPDDVIENIKLLSFMSTSECEWEGRARAGVWSFRLLCGRVRLRVHLHGGGVSVDTPVYCDFEVAKADETDAIAGLCVSLAMGAMRHEAAEVSSAGAVTALLRRCVRVARLARRWARAMRDAHAQLAYRVLPDGLISLKVANLPLRRVVEARLHVSLAVGRELDVAYPCAERLAIATGAGFAGEAWLAAGAESAMNLARLADQPPDWGHVPRTIWKVFKYLKNRTRTEELLGN